MTGKARVLMLAVAAGVLVAGVQSLPAASGPRTPGRPVAPEIRTAHDSALARVSPGLLMKAAKTRANMVLPVAVLAQARAPRPAALERALSVRLAGDKDRRMWVGGVRAGKVAKLATANGVLGVFDNGDRAAPEPPDPDLERAPAKAGIAKRLRALRGASGEQSAPGGAAAKASTPGGASAAAKRTAQARDWSDVADVHRSAAAWAKGYTGSGVRVAVADDGLDFGHPDLAGTVARIDDPSSPFFGWPMAYDPYSMYLYALDRYFSTTYVADGMTWYADTATTVTASADGTATFNGETYHLPAGSVSGVYHMGLFPDENLATFWFGGDIPAVCVVDGTASGVYDRVYVDLDDDNDFADETAMRKGTDTATRDFWNSAGGVPGSDGYADISAGTLYFIADGTNHPPAFDWVWRQYDVDGSPLPLPDPVGAGDMVCLMGAYDLLADHGTLCGSAVAAQGVVNGNAPAYKPAYGGTGTGMVQGGGRDADLVPIADIYSNHFASSLLAFDFAALGPDGLDSSGDEVHIVSNSYGDSADDADAWDFRSRYVTLLNNLLAPSTTFLFSTGNGGPGYGTNAPPSPVTGISVGASTLFGSFGTTTGASEWDSIDTSGQMTYGDVIPFSNRGPTAMGDVAPHVVADGAFAAGDEPLSFIGDGWMATASWGGTSRSTPIASGNLALVYQAFFDEFGQYPDFETARELLMSGARDLSYDPLTQGAGMVDADRSTDLAGFLAGYSVSPDEWTVHRFRGERHPAFAKGIEAGSAHSLAFTVTNHSGAAAAVAVSDEVLVKSSQTTLTVSTSLGWESAYEATRPDYLVDISGLVPADADLMVVRSVQPYGSMDPDGDYTGVGQVADSVFRTLVYDWTDRDSNGRLWLDGNGNGAVNTGEIDPNEYMRLTYGYSVGTSQEVRVKQPASRAHDGLYLGLQHRYRSATVSDTDVTVVIEFYKAQDWAWLTESRTSVSVPAYGQASLTGTVRPPAGTDPGTYAGGLVLSSGGRRVVVPVTANVLATSTSFEFGDGTGAILGQPGPMRGLFDWNWRPEAGDWRFAFANLPDKLLIPDGGRWLIRTSWDTTPTDVDTRVFGPTADEFTSTPGDVFYDLYGPYTLAPVGGSPNTNFYDADNDAAGKWRFDTSSGGPMDFVSAPMANGLNMIALHNVLYSGAGPGENARAEVGTIVTDPGSLDAASMSDSGSEPLGVTPGLDLTGLVAEGFGFVTPDVRAGLDIADGGTYETTLALAHAASLDVVTGNSPGNDIDLTVRRWNGSAWEDLASSEGVADEERVTVLSPVDGEYQVEVFGYDVDPSPATFDMTITAIQGGDVDVSGLPAGAVSAGTTVTASVDWANDWGVTGTSTARMGGVFLGPPEAPRAVWVPMSLTYGTASTTTLRSTRTAVLFGRTVTLVGTVAPAPTTGDVVLEARPWNASFWSEVDRVAGGGTGAFAVADLPSEGTYYRARYLGGAGLAPSVSGVRQVEVQNELTLAAPWVVARRSVQTLSGRLRPAHSTGYIRLQRRVRGVWRTIRSIRFTRTTSTANLYSFRMYFPTRGRQYLRTVFVDGDGLHRSGVSPARRIDVR
jgi:hypothetical protein